MANYEQDFEQFLFERNETNSNVTNTSFIIPNTVSDTTVDTNPLNINELLAQYTCPNIKDIARKFLHHIFEINGNGVFIRMKPSFENMHIKELFIFDIVDDIVYINQIPFEDLLLLGKIKGKNLEIDILPLISININLSKIISVSIQSNQPFVIYKMFNSNINVFQIEPRVMIMAVEMNMDDLVLNLIERNAPVNIEDYRCIYQLADKGRLDILKPILEKYQFPNLTEIICKICVKATIYNQLIILEHFLTEQEFAGAPDQMLIFLSNSVKFNHLDLVKFFVENGVNIRRCDYQVIKQAIDLDRTLIVQYFCQIDDTVIDLLTQEQKEKYGLEKIIMMNQDIGTNILCSISDDEILENETYYQCTNKLHYYKENTWNEWKKYKTISICPLCRSNVKRILYVNKKPNFEMC